MKNHIIAKDTDGYAMDTIYRNHDTLLECTHAIQLQSSLKDVWGAIEKIGGDHGWYFANILWKLRGYIDSLVGGIGLRKGKHENEKLHVGDTLDFWRIQSVEQEKYLQLLAEMKVPGKAVLEFRMTEIGDSCVELYQRASFVPRGFWGVVYWYALYPIHVIVFRGMQKNIAKNLQR